MLNVKLQAQTAIARSFMLALWSAGGDIGRITHFIWGTMSSVVDAFGTECTLMNELKMNADVQRIAVQQMGCMTGFR